jgi:rubrerythrin
MLKIQQKSTAIENIEQLRQYLEVAMKIEHATIPPYLTTAYTANIDVNKRAIDIIRGVAKEEMLHLTLAGNLLNAIGGKPDLLCDDFVPKYPCYLPTGETTFEVNIEKFSSSAIATFMKIERPAERIHEEITTHIKNLLHVKAEDMNEAQLKNETPLVPMEKAEKGGYNLNFDVAMVPHDKLSAKRQSAVTSSFIPTTKGLDADGNEIELHYYSIGEFYKAIGLGFVHLSKEMTHEKLFCGHPRLQVPCDLIFSMGGTGIIVTDLKSALDAIALIAGQGEGNDDQVYDKDNEIAHYYKFDQIAREQCYRDPKKFEGDRDQPGHPQGEKFHVDYEAVAPIKTNAKVADFERDPELQERALLFNGVYKQFLQLLNDGFNGNPGVFSREPKEVYPGLFYGAMFAIETAMKKLINYPIAGTGENAAPTFEMDEFKYPIIK